MKLSGSLDVKSRGYYGISVLNKDGNKIERKSVPHTQNVVTDDGAYWSLFTNYESQMFANLYAKVGTGTSEIVKTSSGLGNALAAISSKVGASRAGNEVDNLDGTTTLTLTRTLSFPMGGVVGTISEVGLFSDTNPTNFIAGQLIKDEFGNPTTVTLLSDEQLVVTYTLEWVVPNVATLVNSGTVTVKGSPVNYEIWVQPYFAAYSPGTSGKNCNWAHHYNVDYLNLVNSSYTKILTSGDNYDISRTRSGNSVTFRTPVWTLSPTSFSSSDIKGFVLTGDSLNSNAFSVVGGKVTKQDNQSTGQRYVPCIITFDPPLNKTNQDSFTIQGEFTVNF